MNSTLAIAQRELIEKRFVFAAAVAFLLLALVVPFMPGVHSGERAGALVIGSLILSTAYTLGLAAILGSSIVGRELADGRLSFYFSKPVPATSIWFGKVIAAAILIVTSFVLIAFPALLAGGTATLRSWAATSQQDALKIFASIAGVAAAFFLITHVIGTFVRSRSPWILFDFIAFAVLGTAIWMLVRLLLLGFAAELSWRVVRIFAAYAGVAIVAAGAWQMARGRTDRRSSHMELSRFLWASLGSGMLIVAAFVAWVVSAAPRDIVIPDFAQQSSTDWAFMGGPAKNRMDYRATFLYNIDSGRFVRIPRMQSWWEALFSSDGNAACWVVPSKEGNEVWTARLDSPEPLPVQTRITLKNAGPLNISADGSRLVSIDREGVLTVDDLLSGSSLGSVKLPTGPGWLLMFARPDLVRIYAFNNNEPLAGRAISILEFDVAHKKLTATGEFPRNFPRFNADRSRMLLPHRSTLEVRDAGTGAIQQTIPGSFMSAKFLHDGRIAAINREQTTMTLFSSDGSVSRAIQLPAMKFDSIYEPSGGPLVACSSRGGCAVIDAVAGSVIRTDAGVHPVSYATTGPRLLSFSHGILVVWNPATGEKRAIN